MPIEALVFVSVDQCRNCIVKRIGIFTQLEKRKRYSKNKEKKVGTYTVYIMAEVKRCVCVGILLVRLVAFYLAIKLL